MMIEAIVPAGATTGPVTLVNADGNATTARNFVVAENRAVSTGTLASSTPVPAGIYNNFTVTSNGAAPLTDSTRVVGTLTVQAGGVLLTNNKPLVGTGNFVLAVGATLGVAHADGLGNPASPGTGAVQLTGARSHAAGAAYRYNGTGTQITGLGLPASAATLTLDNAAGLALSQDLTTTTALALVITACA